MYLLQFMIYSILQIVPIMELCSSLDLFNLLCVSLTVRKLIKKKCFLLFPDFSLHVWKQSKYLNIYEPLPEYGLSLLFEELGVAQYLNQRQCSGNSIMYNNTVLTNGLFIVFKDF